MTDKQLRFVDEYLVDFNATQAAIRAGYSEKTAAEQGYQLLQKTSVLKFLEERKNGLKRQLQEQFTIDALSARKVMYDILNNDESSDRDRITVAKDFLDRAGFKAPEKIEHSGEINNPFAGLTTDELRRLAGAYDDDG